MNICRCCNGLIPAEDSTAWEAGEADCTGRPNPHGACGAFATWDPKGDALEAIKDAYDAAIGCWAGADWTHGNGTSPDGSPIYCTGETEDCDTCLQAAAAAAEAEESALAAINAARKGEWALASRLAEEASTTEAEWGDDPVWAPLAMACQDALRDLVNPPIVPGVEA